jgi:glycosyltransferase involved in cell wall biosynthesis
MGHADFIAKYDVPVVDPAARRPTLRWARRGEGRARLIAGDLRVRLRGPRLAYIDSHFPWRRSGFRYADALALHEARPDTVFFSMYEMRDSFPAPVLPLAQFPRLAPSLGVTDVYGVFLGFMAGILGLRQDHPGEPEPIEGLDLSRVLRHEGIRAHVGLYPGGGFVATEAGFADARRLVEAADSVFSWAPAVLEHVPGVAAIEPAIVDTTFYAATPRDFGARPFELLFVADARPRKGLDVALAALHELANEAVHLHVVGPHDPASWDGPIQRASFHGWLEREEIRELHRRCHVFVSPVSRERPDDPSGDGGVTDGFPTAAAGEAMSSGCLLITSNPDADHRALRPGVDHMEVPATATAFAGAVRSVLTDPRAAAAIAASGARRVRERLDVRMGAAVRLQLMELGSGARRGTRAQRVRKPVPAREAPPEAPLVVLAREVRAIGDELRAIGEELRVLRTEETRRESEYDSKLAAMREDLVAIGQLVLDDEAASRRLLDAVRAAPEYEEPFNDPAPLVSICIPTYTNYRGLVERAIPSALEQDHENVEVVVVGDAAPPETAEAIQGLGEPRVRFENLTVRGPYPEDPQRRWLVAGTGPLNRSVDLARGAWITILNDDDALRANHASLLVATAQARRDEVVYGAFEQHAPDGSSEVLGRFPPQLGQFGWQCAVHHRDIARLFRYELAAALFGEPGDWHRARRMLRAGVRFSMVDEIVFDYYPGLLWRDP